MECVAALPVWKLWIISGLGLQVLAVLPPLLEAFQPKFKVNYGEGTGPDKPGGVITGIDTRVHPAQWTPSLLAFALIAAGGVCQIRGLILSP